MARERYDDDYGDDYTGYDRPEPPPAPPRYKPPPGDELTHLIQSWYVQTFGNPANAEEVHTWRQRINEWGKDAAYQMFQRDAAPYVPQQPQPQGRGGGGGGGGGVNLPAGLSMGSLLEPYTGQYARPPGWTPPTYEGPAPWEGFTRERFTPPGYQAPPPFTYKEFQAPGPFQAPTGEDVQKEPGFQFRLNQGREALERSAAGRGTLLTGGTLQDLLRFGQDFASTEYGNIYNRRFGEYQTGFGNALAAHRTGYDDAARAYQTNYQTQYIDPYENRYRGALDAYDRLFNARRDAAQMQQRQRELDYERLWREYGQGYDIWRENRERPFRFLTGAMGYGLQGQ